MIILTGASGGIGKEIVNQLTKIDHVLGLYNTSLPENTENEKVQYVKLDIEKPDEIEAFVNEWKAKLCRVTLIHCAASKVDGLVANYSLSDWDHVMGVNLRGNFLDGSFIYPPSEEWKAIQAPLLIPQAKQDLLVCPVFLQRSTPDSISHRIYWFLELLKLGCT